MPNPACCSLVKFWLHNSSMRQCMACSHSLHNVVHSPSNIWYEYIFYVYYSLMWGQSVFSIYLPGHYLEGKNPWNRKSNWSGLTVRMRSYGSSVMDENCGCTPLVWTQSQTYQMFLCDTCNCWHFNNVVCGWVVFMWLYFKGEPVWLLDVP